MEKREYQQPVLKTAEIRLGVFGDYGQDDGGGGRRLRGPHGRWVGGGGLDGWPWGGGN